MSDSEYSLPAPDFETIPERKLVALARSFTMDTRSEIPALWQAFWSSDWKLNGEIDPAKYGVSYSVNTDGSFNYGVGVHVAPMPTELPEGACQITLSAGRYAVFRNKGSVQQLPTTFDAIFSRWLPSSNETQREGAVFERYPNDENSSAESMTYEIWVPIKD